MVVALTSSAEIVLVEEFRPAVNAPVISLPSGLVGDEGPESAENAARRELREETGYEASRLEFLGRGPGSAGQSSEMVTFFLATGAARAGEQSPDDRARIRVHVVALAELRGWAARAEGSGAAVDPKVFAGVYLAEHRAAVR